MLHLPRLSDDDRRPWVTYGIALLLVLLFVGTQVTARRRLHHGCAQLKRAVAYHGEHPGLRLDPRLVRFRPPADRTGAAPPEPGGRATAPRFKALEQVELDGITRGGFDTLASTPLWRWGVVPARFSPIRLFTYPFLHASFLPLALNLVFLLLCGPTLEADWGRRFHVAFLWASASLGGAAFTLANRSLDAALAGSSAAIVALVTAYLFRHWRHNLRPLAWLPAPRANAFSLSAPGLMALWVLREGVTPWAGDLVSLPGIGGAALWAHAGSFLFAAGVLAALRWADLDERFLRHIAPPLAAPRKASVSGTPEVPPEETAQEREWAQLLASARDNPQDREALDALWETAVTAERTGEVAPLMLARIRDEVHGASPLEAFELWGRLREHTAHVGLPLSLETRLAEALETAEYHKEAALVLSTAIERATTETAPATLNRLLRLASGPERSRITALARAAAVHSPEVRAELVRPLQGPRPPTPCGVLGKGVGEDVLNQGGGLRPVRARPLALDDGQITLELDAGPRRGLRLDRVRALAAAAVDQGLAEANLVLDLFLQAPGEGKQPERSLRLETHGFDPRALVPDKEHREDAFVAIADTMLSASGAAWLLGEGPRDLRRYPSLAAYEEELLRVLRLSSR